MDQGSKVDELNLNLVYWLIQTFFCRENTHGVHIDPLLCEKVDFLSSASLDHGGRNGVATQIFLRFRQMRAFSNAQDHPH